MSTSVTPEWWPQPWSYNLRGRDFGLSKPREGWLGLVDPKRGEVGHLGQHHGNWATFMVDQLLQPPVVADRVTKTLATIWRRWPSISFYMNQIGLVRTRLVLCYKSILSRFGWFETTRSIHFDLIGLSWPDRLNLDRLTKPSRPVQMIGQIQTVESYVASLSW